jgi:hypothetical protein
VEITPAPTLDAPLPAADVVVVTWTIDEQMALCDVLTPGITRVRWYRYARKFNEAQIAGLFWRLEHQ